jgi:hypothetical protein
MFPRHLPFCVHPSGIHPRDRSLALWHQPFIRHQPRSMASTMFLRHLPSCVYPSGIHPGDRSLALWHQPFIRYQPRSMPITLFLRHLPFVSTHEASTIGIVLRLCFVMQVCQHYLCLCLCYVLQHYLCLVFLLCASTLLFLCP